MVFSDMEPPMGHGESYLQGEFCISFYVIFDFNIVIYSGWTLPVITDLKISNNYMKNWRWVIL